MSRSEETSTTKQKTTVLHKKPAESWKRISVTNKSKVIREIQNLRTVYLLSKDRQSINEKMFKATRDKGNFRRTEANSNMVTPDVQDKNLAINWRHYGRDQCCCFQSGSGVRKGTSCIAGIAVDWIVFAQYGTFEIDCIDTDGDDSLTLETCCPWYELQEIRMWLDSPTSPDAKLGRRLWRHRKATCFFVATKCASPWVWNEDQRIASGTVL